MRVPPAIIEKSAHLLNEVQISQDGLTICVSKRAVMLRAEETFPVKDVK